MTRLDCLAWCARYYQYYEYAILSEILPTLPDAENNTTGLSCLIKNPVKRQKTTTVVFLVECWDWELFKDKCLIFPVAARPVRREYSVASLGNPNHLVYDLYLFTSDL